MAERIAFPHYQERIEARIKELGFESVLALATAKTLQPYQVYRWVRVLPAHFEDLVRLAAALEVPWQWLIVGDDIKALTGFLKVRERAGSKRADAADSSKKRSGR